MLMFAVAAVALVVVVSTIKENGEYSLSAMHETHNG